MNTYKTNFHCIFWNPPGLPLKVDVEYGCPKVKELEKSVEERDAIIFERDVTISDLRNENAELKRQITEGN